MPGFQGFILDSGDTPEARSTDARGMVQCTARQQAPSQRSPHSCGSAVQQPSPSGPYTTVRAQCGVSGWRGSPCSTRAPGCRKCRQGPAGANQQKEGNECLKARSARIYATVTVTTSMLHCCRTIRLMQYHQQACCTGSPHCHIQENHDTAALCNCFLEWAATTHPLRHSPSPCMPPRQPVLPA